MNREYSWKKNQIEKKIEHLFRIYFRKNNHYIGQFFENTISIILGMYSLNELLKQSNTFI